MKVREDLLKSKWKRTAACLAALFVFGSFILFWLMQPAKPKSGPLGLVAAPLAQLKAIRSAPAPRTQRTTGLDAANIDAKEAKRLLVLALTHLITARSYKSVMTTTSFSGNGTVEFYFAFTLQHLKSASRGDLFRCDTLNFSGPADDFTPETMQLIPKTARTEITNESGNWDFGDETGKEGKAFHLTGNEVPLETVDMHESLQKAAQQLGGDPDPSSFRTSNENDRDTRVVAIAYAAAGGANPYDSTYLLDPNTGELLTITGGGIRRDFNLSAPIDESEFSVPASLEQTPVENQEALRRYIGDHRK